MAGSALIRKNGWRLSAKLLVASTLITILGFTAVCISVMLDMRRAEGELALRTGENLASSIDADISRNIEVYDLSLRAVVSNMISAEIKGVSRELRHLILFDHAATAKHFSAMQIFNADGQLTIDASSLDPVPMTIAHEEFFEVHRQKLDVGLFISRPTMHRGEYSIVLSRRIQTEDGKFAGVVAGAIRFSYFHDLFGRLRLDADDSITILRHDGILVTRTPFNVGAIGRDFSASTVAKHILGSRSGSMTGTSDLDGVVRFYIWRDSTKPLIVVVGKPWANIYAMWQNQATRIAAVVMVLIAFAVAMTLFLGSEISRRARAEESLEELATTDALTGLRNRRKFNLALEQEWRRAERSATPLALLMIDADHFKSYNDTFGHQAGDAALAAIAGCIAAAARRAGDCAARYGGEEFALLLPGLSGPDALQVAEAIRREVAMLDGDHGPLTISIGVAVATPDGGSSPIVLLESADKALYMAKATGRNQSRLATGAPFALVA